MKPSEERDAYWLMEVGAHPIPDQRYVGKWLIFVDVSQVDEVWNRIREMTERGRLGVAAKVSTSRPNIHRKSENERVICVFTDDYRDTEDVFMVRDKLASMGFTQTLYYKTDNATRSGIYGENSWLYKE